MIEHEHHERTGQILRHGRTTHGRLPTWQRHRPRVHGARTGRSGGRAVRGQDVRPGRRGVR